MTEPIMTPEQAIEAAARDAETHLEAGRRICCDGRECGCYGATVGDVVAYSIRALASRIPEPDEDVVERVARALWDADEHDDGFESTSEFWRSDYRTRARAAIAAMPGQSADVERLTAELAATRDLMRKHYEDHQRGHRLLDEWIARSVTAETERDRMRVALERIARLVPNCPSGEIARAALEPPR